MVRLNSSIQLRDSSDHERLHDLLTRLCETSLREKGTIDYNAYHSIIYDDRHIVSATFADRHAFESHAAATRELKDEVERIATLTYETFDF
ncbi:MAG: hypothetical protein JFR38_05770 [Muribaculaceae bacterium]|nr:hypothetical protein [Muribaculaceae bacterium]